MINHLPYGSDNMGLEVSATPTATSPNPNIKLTALRRKEKENGTRRK